MIRAIKPIKMTILSLNGNWISWISVILFIAAHFVTVSINDALCQKTSPIFASVSSVH
jgi:hypothetical protein